MRGLRSIVVQFNAVVAGAGGLKPALRCGRKAAFNPAENAAQGTL